MIGSFEEPARANLAHRLEPVHLGHHDVHQHEIEAVAVTQAFERSRPLRAIQLGALRLEQLEAQDVAHVVFGDQDRRPSKSASRSRACRRSFC